MRHTHHVNYNATRQVGFCSVCDFYGAMEFVWCNLISLNDKFSNHGKTPTASMRLYQHGVMTLVVHQDILKGIIFYGSL